jgi:hypothetical protein
MLLDSWSQDSTQKEQIKNTNKKLKNNPMQSSRPNFERGPLTSRNMPVATIPFDAVRGSIAPEPRW